MNISKKTCTFQYELDDIEEIINITSMRIRSCGREQEYLILELKSIFAMNPRDRMVDIIKGELEELSEEIINLRCVLTELHDEYKSNF